MPIETEVSGSAAMVAWADGATVESSPFASADVALIADKLDPLPPDAATEAARREHPEKSLALVPQPITNAASKRSQTK